MSSLLRPGAVLSAAGSLFAAAKSHVTRQTALYAPQVAVISVVPPPTAMILPCWLTVATSSSPDV